MITYEIFYFQPQAHRLLVRRILRSITIFHVPLPPSGTLEQKKSVPVPLSTHSEHKNGTAHLPTFPTVDDFLCLLTTSVGVFTILEVKSGKGSTSGWGRLKSGAGWISLDFVKRV